MCIHILICVYICIYAHVCIYIYIYTYIYGHESQPYVGNTNMHIPGGGKNGIYYHISEDIQRYSIYRLEDIPYAGVICNIISNCFLRSAYSPRRVATRDQLESPKMKQGRVELRVSDLSLSLSSCIYIYINI